MRCVPDVGVELVRMKPGQAEAVFLHDVLGYTLRDIAQMCGVTSPAAQSRLLRGRQDLFRRMGWRLPEERS
jgi:DNA-directed RNA polymerase specialized sigma24 family protein